MDAAEEGIALVVGAQVAVVAVHHGQGHAAAVFAVIAVGAGVPVVAFLGGGLVDAAVRGMAEIRCADVAVVAVQVGLGSAEARCADVTEGACVVVRACHAVVVRLHEAITGLPIADRCLADSVETLGRGAGDHRRRVHLALERHLADVAEEGPVADIPVLDDLAIRVGLAVAGHRGAQTGGVYAVVTDGAGIPVIAEVRVRRVLASCLGVADVVGAGVVVIAGDRNPRADPALAEVALSARCAVVAREALENLIDAASGPAA